MCKRNKSVNATIIIIIIIKFDARYLLPKYRGYGGTPKTAQDGDDQQHFLVQSLGLLVIDDLFSFANFRHHGSGFFMQT